MSRSTLTGNDRKVEEGSTFSYTATLKNEDGVVIPAATLDVLTLTLYEIDGNTDINSRTAQNVLNTNGVTVSSDGELVWTATPADNVIVDSTLQPGEFETHVALFEYEWDTNAKKSSHELTLRVRVIRNV